MRILPVKMQLRKLRKFTKFPCSMDIKVWSFNEKILTQPKFEVDYCAYIASDPCIFGRGKTPTIARVNAEKGFVKAGLK